MDSSHAELKQLYPDVEFGDINSDVNVREIEAMYPGIVLLIQKNVEFFSTERILFGVNLSDLEVTDNLWRILQTCCISSFFHGDIKEKLSTAFNAAKTLWGASGQENSEVEKLLNDENTEDYIREMFEYVSNLRSAKVFIQMFEEIDIESLGLNLDNPAELFDMVKNPEHPIMQKAVGSIQKILKSKLETGQLTQHQLTSDIEGVKAKVQNLFGNAFNEMLGGRGGATPPSVIMSNAPEARRQRMLARLQRKQREKTQR
jgi:hypothetical protein